MISPSAFRTFWSIFLVVGLTVITTGGFVAVCAGPLASQGEGPFSFVVVRINHVSGNVLLTVAEVWSSW